VQTLGISDTPQKTDNWFQRICWPSDSPYELSALSRRGFWMCIIVAVVSFVVLLVQGHVILAPLVLAVYALGGVGVREGSFAAANVIFLVYLVDNVGSILIAHRPPGVLGIVILLVLAGNIRAAWIAAKWKPVEAEQADDAYAPEPTWRDKLADRMPAAVWPVGKFLFFSLAVIYMGLEILGTAVTIFRHRMT
jgi:hypothetical protein